MRAAPDHPGVSARRRWMFATQIAERSLRKLLEIVEAFWREQLLHAPAPALLRHQQFGVEVVAPTNSHSLGPFAFHM